MAGQTKRTSRRKPSGFPSIFIFPLQNVPGYVYLCSSVPRHRPSAASDLKKNFFCSPPLSFLRFFLFLPLFLSSRFRFFYSFGFFSVVTSGSIVFIDWLDHSGRGGRALINRNFRRWPRIHQESPASWRASHGRFRRAVKQY